MTDHGLEKLSKAIPSDPDEIERLIAEARKASKPAWRLGRRRLPSDMDTNVHSMERALRAG